MAARVKTTTAAGAPSSWNPLACSGTWMRPNALVMAKLSWLLLAVGGYWNFFAGPYAPSVGLLTPVPGIGTVMTLAFWLGGVCLLFNRAVRIAAVVTGAAVLLLPFESLAAWHPHAWVAGCVMTLSALHGPGEKPRFVRGFMILVQVAALLGAIHGPGWAEMAVSAPWSDGDFVGAVPRWLTRHFAPETVAAVLHGATIATCAVVIPALLLRRSRLIASWIVLGFYLGLYLALGNPETARFAGAVAIGQIAFLNWPRHMVVVWPRACGWPLWLRIVLDRYDFDHRTDWPRPPDPDAHLEAWFDGRRRTGANAILHLVLFLPAFHFAIFGLLATIHLMLPPFVGVPVNTGIFALLLAFSAYASVSAIRSRRAEALSTEHLIEFASDSTGTTSPALADRDQPRL